MSFKLYSFGEFHALKYIQAKVKFWSNRKKWSNQTMKYFYLLTAIGNITYAKIFIVLSNF